MERRQPTALVRQLLDVVDRSTLVEPARFAALVDGLLELRSSLPVVPSVIVVRPPVSARDDRCLIAALLLANIRDADVMSWVDDDALAILIDGDRSVASGVARRLEDLLARTFGTDPSWIGVVTASPAWTVGADLIDSAAGALAWARRDPRGAIAVATT